MVKRIKKQWLYWLGQVVRMDGKAPVLEVFDAVPGVGSGRKKDFPSLEGSTEKDLATLGIPNWRQTAKRRVTAIHSNLIV